MLSGGDWLLLYEMENDKNKVAQYKREVITIKKVIQHY